MKVKKKEVIENIFKGKIERKKMVERILEISKEKGLFLYFVGGSVRDYLLGRESKDLDLLIEGDISKLFEKLKKIEKFHLLVHPRFNTGVLRYMDEEIDLIQGRHETYPEEGKLPIVEKGTILEDLKRRDFTVNALGIRFYPWDERLIDPTGGYRDLMEKRIKIIHEKSFLEDPTRILRCFKFSTRLNFKIEEETEKRLKESIERESLETISQDRKRRELKKTIYQEESKYLKENIEKLISYNYFKGEKKGKESLTEEKLNQLIRCKKEVLSGKETIGDREKFLAQYLILGDVVPNIDFQKVVEEFNFSQKRKEKILEILYRRDDLVEEIRKGKKISDLVRILEKIPKELKLYIYIILGCDKIRERIKKIYGIMEDYTPLINGRDLIEKGIDSKDEIRKYLKKGKKIQLDTGVEKKEELLLKLLGK